MSPSPIDLNREFLRFQVNETGQGKSFDAALHWDDLLQSSCVVILGEAGTGKTTELRGQVERLNASGGTAFFLRIEDLPVRGLRGSLWPDQQSVYDRWLQSPAGAVGWFFLDAVDESRLKGQRFDDALRSAAQALGDDGARSRFVISCRVSDWTSGDHEVTRKLVGLLVPSAPDVPVVSLAPLDRPRVRQLAEHYGVSDITSFFDAIREAGAWSFVERPLDVAWLAAYWRQFGRFGSWRDLVDHNVREKLKARPDRPSTLSLDRAREGAATLAAACSLTKLEGIAVPGEELTYRADAVDASAVLSQWSPEDVRDLLSRGLFDEATYGRVRVHHRTVREFLAAEHFTYLLDRGLPASDLHAVVFPRVDGVPTASAHLAPIAAWLALSHGSTRRRLTALAPEALLEGGDSAQLGLEERAEVLRAYAERLRANKQGTHFFGDRELRRFASTPLEVTIRSLLQEQSTPEHITCTLLRMIEVGQLVGCGEAARRLALSNPPDVRNAALRASSAVSSGEELESVLAQLDGNVRQEDAVVYAVIDVAFPRALSVAQVARLLSEVDSQRDSDVIRLDAFLRSEFMARCTVLQQRELLAHVVADAFMASSDTEAALSERTSLRAFVQVLGRFIGDLLCAVFPQCDPPRSELVGALDLVLEAERQSRHGWIDSIARGVEGSPEVRQALFWRCVTQVAMKRAFPRHLWDLGSAWPFQFLDSDAEWLEDNALHLPLERERALAFNTLLNLTRAANEREISERVARIAASDPGRARRLQRWMAAAAASRPEDPTIRRYERQGRASQSRRERERAATKEALTAVLSEIRAGTNVRAISHLHWIAWSKKDDLNAAVLHEHIAEAYGTEIAAAGMEGLRNLWRVNEPPLIHERPDNSTPGICVLGLCGLALDTEAGVVVAQLDDLLLERAIRYAAWELGSFPTWMRQVALLHPSRVGQEYERCLVADHDVDCDSAASRPSLGRIMWKLETADDEIKHSCKPQMLALIQQRDPQCAEMLARCLRILSSCNAWSDPAFYALAEARCLAAKNEPKRFAAWWTEWVFKNAIAAAETLDAVSQQSEAVGDALVLEAASSLARRNEYGRGSTQPFPFEDDPDLLERLLCILFRHVRISEDITRDGGYSPEDRDFAQDLRRRLLNSFLELGTRALPGLDRMIENRHFAGYRDWLRRVREIRRSTVEGLSLEDALELIQRRRLVPRTAEALYAIVAARLEDVREHLERGNFSTRGAYSSDNAATSEQGVQTLLADQLDRRRNEQYAVAREVELADGTEPDVWAICPAVEAPIPIEVKVAERWSGTELRNALVDQLVGKYMRAKASRHGAYVLFSSGPIRAKGWESASGEWLNFSQLIEELEAIASRVAAERDDVSEILVVGIDLH